MAVRRDIDNFLIPKLLSFYDFKDKSIIEVGGGSGIALSGYGSLVRRAAVTEIMPAAIDNLRKITQEKGWGEKVSIINSPTLEGVTDHADVALFFFALHEIPDQEKMLRDARARADNVIIVEFNPGSKWTFLSGEEDKVRSAANVMHKIGMRRADHDAYTNAFDDYQSLYDYIVPYSNLPRRLDGFKGMSNFNIRIPFRIVEMI